MGGFSAVLGNPPWEVLAIEEQAWFAGKSDAIVKAKNASQRKKEIAMLANSQDQKDKQLHQQYMQDIKQLTAQRSFISKSGLYPFSGIGKLNLFALFTELSRISLHQNGHMGIIIPPNIFTGATYLNFLNDLLDSKTLKEGIVFENESLVFPSVHHAFKFALVSISGLGQSNLSPIFTGFIRSHEEIHDSNHRYSLQRTDVDTINPNTGNIPMFRHTKDALITLKIHSSSQILWLDNRNNESNKWNISYNQMFNMASDSGKFHSKPFLQTNGWVKEGYNWYDGHNSEEKSPLHEGKMIWLYDHRYGTYEGQTEANLRQGVVPKVTESQHSNPNYIPLHRYWVDTKLVEDYLLSKNWKHNWMFAFRDVGPSERTMVITVVPRGASGHSTPLLLPNINDCRKTSFLLANLSSIVCDYAIRQKSSRMTLYVIKQAPVFTPPSDETPTPWPGDKLLDFITPRVLELTYTSHDLKDWAKDLGYDGEPFIWDKERRFKLKSELDALFFHMYGLNREQVEWVLESFNVLKGYEEKSFDKGGYGEFKTRRLILESYDAMDYDIKKGRKYEPRWLTQNEEIQRLLSGENLHIEYKETMKQPRGGGNEATVSKSFRKAVIGMANNEGGTILIGVKDKKSGGGEPVGFDDGLINDPDMAQMTAIQLIESKSAYAATLINPKVVDINGINILRIDVKAADKPVYCNLGEGDNQFYLRLANKMSDPERLIGTELENYLYQRFGII
jgi:hypothetical protein